MNFELCDDCGIRLRTCAAGANRNAQNSKSASWLLPCLHAFCSACKAKYIEHDAQKSRLICPKCHVECCDEHILALPTPNDGLNRVCETAACPDKQAATMKCVQCNELLCEACGQAHRRVTATSSHILQPIGSGFTDHTLCRHHNGRKLTIYCSCGTMLCEDCLSMPQSHDGGTHNKTPIQKLASISRIDENQVFSSALREKANIDYSLSMIQVRKNALDESVSNLRKELGNQVVQICQSVMRRGNDLLRALDTVTRCKTIEYDKLQEELSRQKIRLERIKAFVTEVRDYKDPAAVIVTKQFLENCIRVVKTQKLLNEGAVNGLQRAPQVELKSNPENVVNALNQWGCVLSDLGESGVLKVVEVPPTPSTSNLLDVPMFRINNSNAYNNSGTSIASMSFLSQCQQKSDESIINKQSSSRHSSSVQLPTTSTNILPNSLAAYNKSTTTSPSSLNNNTTISNMNQLNNISTNVSFSHLRMPTAFPLTHPQNIHFIQQQQQRFKLAQEVSLKQQQSNQCQTHKKSNISLNEQQNTPSSSSLSQSPNKIFQRYPPNFNNNNNTNNNFIQQQLQQSSSNIPPNIAACRFQSNPYYYANRPGYVNKRMHIYMYIILNISLVVIYHKHIAYVQTLLIVNVVAPPGGTRCLSPRIAPCPFPLDSGLTRSSLSNPPQMMLPNRLSYYQQQPHPQLHLNTIFNPSHRQQQPHSMITQHTTQNDSMLQIGTTDSTNSVTTPIPASILMEEFDCNQQNTSLNQFISPSSSPNKMTDVQRSNEQQQQQPSTSSESLEGSDDPHSVRTNTGNNHNDTVVVDQNADGNNNNGDNSNGVASNSSPPPKDPAPLKNAALKVKIRFSNATTITTTTSTATLINDPEHISHKSATEIPCSSSDDNEDMLKNETVQVRAVDEASKWDDYCYVCQQGCDEKSGSLGCCAKCPRVYHNYCHIPPIKQPMESLPDEWACSSCMAATPLIENSGVMGSRERLLCSKVLLKCYENFLQAEPFSHAVPKTVPNYYVIIKHPMDFGTIARRLREKSKDAFMNVHQFIQSMNLVFENCSTFNPPDNEVAEAGRNVYNLYVKAVKQFLPCMKGHVWLYVNKYSEARNNMLIQKDYLNNYHQQQNRNHLTEMSTCEPVMKKTKKDIKNELV